MVRFKKAESPDATGIHKGQINKLCFYRYDQLCRWEFFTPPKTPLNF